MIVYTQPTFVNMSPKNSTIDKIMCAWPGNFGSFSMTGDSPLTREWNF